MSSEYSAFISYRHAPADIAVASEIQKRLERYPVPAAIQKKTGKKKIGKIFRDKEELPITSDLNDDITAALENADYLIVICSTSTKESMWVEREINTFLKYHSKREILTVLVNGEPYDVIPEVLLTDTVERTAPDGTVYEETINYEPLSCDFRSGMKTARRTEIPRLAAALLGCKYDELVMRERQYRRRRLTAILSTTGTLAAIALCYLLWSRAEIKKNYDLAQYNYELSEQNRKKAEENYEEAQRNLDQALINQSEYLSSESEDLLEDGDRLRAIELAMGALPSAENERPLTPQAEKALAVALNAYMPPETADRQNAMAEISEFRTDGSGKYMYKTEDGKYLLVLDDYGIVYVWNIDTAELVFELRSGGAENANTENASSDEPASEQEVYIRNVIQSMKDELEAAGEDIDPEKKQQLEDTIRAMQDSLEKLQDSIRESGAVSDAYFKMQGIMTGTGEIQSLRVLTNETIAVKSSAGVFAYNFITGEELWNYKKKDYYWYNARLDASGDGSTVYVIRNEYSPYSLNPVPCTFSVTAINAESGEVTAENSLVTDWEASGYIYGSAVSEDGGRMAFAAGLDQTELTYGHLYVFNREDGSITEVPVGERFSEVQCMRFCDDTHFAVMGYPEYTWFESGGNVGILGLMTTIKDYRINMIYVDSENAAIVSENAFASPQVNYLPMDEGICFIRDGENASVVCAYANKIAVFDAASGDKLDEVEFTGSIVEGGVTDKKRVVCYLKNGSLGVYDPEEKGEESEISYFSFDNYGMLSVPRPGDDSVVRFLVAAEPNTIRLYDTVYDQDFKRFEESVLPSGATFSANEIVGDFLVLLDYDSILYIQDLTGKEPLRKMVLAENPYKFEYLGKDEENGVIWLQDKTESENDILCVSLADGETWPLDPAGDAYANYRVQRDGRLTYLSREDVTVLNMSDPKNPTVEHTIPVGDMSLRYFVSRSSKTVISSREDETAKTGYRAYLTMNGQETQNELPIAPQDSIRLADWNEEEDRMAMTDGYKVFLMDGNGVPISELNDAGQEVVSFTFYEDELIVLYSAGRLTRYDAQTGAFHGRSLLRHYETEHFMDNTDWTFRDGILYFERQDTIRHILSFIDLDTWEESLGTSYVYGYDAARDRIICGGKDRSTGETAIGYYEHYTTEDLLRKGKEALGSFSMTDEEKATYGL